MLVHVFFFNLVWLCICTAFLGITSDNRNATSLINPVSPLINQVVS